MTTIEESLRKMFAGQVEAPPPTGDLADTVLRRGRRIWLRRTAVSTVAAACALVLTIGAITSLRGWDQMGDGRQQRAAPAFNGDLPWTVTPHAPHPSSTVDTGIGLDIRLGDRLWTTDGRQLRLTGVSRVDRVYRVPDGWVYGDDKQVRLLRTDGGSIALSGEHGRWALSADGTRITFAVGTDLYLASLGASGMAVRTSLKIPAQSTPVALLDADRVVLATGTGRYALLDPARTAPLVWQEELTTVLAGGGALITLVRDGEGRTCLAELRPVDGRLRPGRTGGCHLGLNADRSGTPALAPDGAWLAVPGPGELSLINVGRTLQDRAMALTCPVRGEVAPQWADTGTVIADHGHGVQRCRTDGESEIVALPAGVGGDWQLVPRLAPAPNR